MGFPDKQFRLKKKDTRKIYLDKPTKISGKIRCRPIFNRTNLYTVATIHFTVMFTLCCFKYLNWFGV